MDPGSAERAGAREKAAYGRAGKWLLALSVGAILVATITPVPGQPTVPVSWCLVCGEHGTADAVANLLLFLPLGVACALAGWRPLAAVLGAALLSATIETVQFALPGRDPSLGDVLCNTAGAALGVYATAAALRRRGRPLPAWTPLAGATAVLGAVLAAGGLLRPLPPPGDYYGIWTAGLEHGDTYDGRVVGVTLSSTSLPSWRLAGAPTIAGLLRAGAPLKVHAIAGPPPNRLAPLFAITTGSQEEVMLLGFDGGDIVYRLRRVSEALRLDAPDLRVRRAAAGVAPGSPMTLQVWRQEGGYCITLNTRKHCGLGWTPGRVWAVVLYETRLGGAIGALLDALCIGLLLLPVGLTLRRDAWSVAGVGLAAAALLLVPPWVGLLRARPAEIAAAGAALLLPGLVAAYRRGRAGRLTSAPTVSARASSATHRSMRV
jgi:hypothetical protein